jgi:hypothetical protein
VNCSFRIAEYAQLDGGGPDRQDIGDDGPIYLCAQDRRGGGWPMGKGSTGAAAGGGAIYGLGIFGALFYYWQQANSFWEYVWAIFPKAIFWPAYMVYEGFRALGA